MATIAHKTKKEDQTASSKDDCLSDIEDSSEHEGDDDSIASLLVPTPITSHSATTTTATNRGRSSPARTNAKGVPVPTQVELAEDIEKLFKGLAAFNEDPYSTSKLCRQKTDLYGESGSQLRQQVRDKLKSWKKLSLVEYEQVLKDLGVWTSSQTNTQTKLRSDNLEQPRRPQVKVSVTKPKPSSQSPQLTFLQPKKDIMNAPNTFTIKVNTAHPEANREVMVYDLDRIQGAGEANKNTLYKGFWICLPIDVRFILDDVNTEHWKARVFSSNSVLLSIQAWNYSHLYDRDELETNVDENVLEAIDNCHHGLEDESSDVKEARKWKHLLLQFGDGVELSAKHIFLGAGDDEKLKLELLAVTVTHKKMPTLNYTSMYAAWKVARIDMKPNKKGKVEKQEDKSEAARLLEKINGGIAGEPKKVVDGELSSEEWLEEQLVKIQHAKRLEKAKETLREMRELDLEAGKDTAWVDGMIADMEKFVADNKEELDALIAKDAEDNNNNENGGGKKRGRGGEEKSDPDQPMPDSAKSEY